jgi:hypothetical protein
MWKLCKNSCKLNDFALWNSLVSDFVAVQRWYTLHFIVQLIYSIYSGDSSHHWCSSELFLFHFRWLKRCCVEYDACRIWVPIVGQHGVGKIVDNFPYYNIMYSDVVYILDKGAVCSNLILDRRLCGTIVIMIFAFSCCHTEVTPPTQRVTKYTL